MDSLFVQIVIAFGCLATAAACAAQCTAWWMLARKATKPVTKNGYGVSVLKPVKGHDEGLYENLAAIARQNYRPLEVIIAAADLKDPALTAVRRVQFDFPDVDIRVLSNVPNYGLNPKVATLHHILPLAKHDMVLISDSNVRPEPDYVGQLVAEMEDKDAVLAHNVLAGTGANGVSGELENMQMNTWVVSAICASEIIGNYPCVIGKSMLFRRSQFSDFTSVKNILAEDHVIGAHMHRTVGNVTLSGYPLPVIAGRRTLKDFANRHLRWSQMRRRINPIAYLAELTLSPIPWLITGMCVWPAAKLGTPWLAAATAALIVKLTADLALNHRLSGGTSWLSLPVALGREFLILGFWVVGWFKRTVVWRGNVFLVGPDSRLEPVDDAMDAEVEDAVY